MGPTVSIEMFGLVTHTRRMFAGGQLADPGEATAGSTGFLATDRMPAPSWALLCLRLVYLPSSFGPPLA